MTTAEQTTVTFVSPYPNLRLVISPADVLRNHHGNVIGKIDGSSVEFDGGELPVTDPDVIDFLRTHPQFNVKFYERDGVAPDEPKPTVAERLKAITEAAVARDGGALGAILADEAATHNRNVVVDAVASAQAAVEGDSAESPDADDA